MGVILVAPYVDEKCLLTCDVDRSSSSRERASFERERDFRWERICFVVEMGPASYYFTIFYKVPFVFVNWEVMLLCCFKLFGNNMQTNSIQIKTLESILSRVAKSSAYLIGLLMVIAFGLKLRALVEKY